MPAAEQALAGAPVFAALTPSQLQAVAACGARERAPAGTLLLREGEPAQRLYVIEHGAVAIEVHVSAGGPLVIETLHDGDALGLSWLFEPYRWQFDGRAMVDCELIAFDAACVRAACEADHELGYRLISAFAAVMTARLQATRLQLLDVYGRGRGAS